MECLRGTYKCARVHHNIARPGESGSHLLAGVPSRGSNSSAPVVAKASSQQEQQPAPPLSNFRDLMQQYRGLVKAPAAPATHKKAAGGSSSSGSSSSRDAGGPRLKPTRQTAALTGSSTGKRKGAALPAAAAAAAAAAKAGQGSRKAAAAAGGASSSTAAKAGAKVRSTSSSSRTSRSSSSSSSPTNIARSSSSSPPASVVPAGWLLPSNGKGFGSIATPGTAAAAAATDAAAGSRRSSDGRKLVRVFRYGVEAAALQRVIAEADWSSRVVLVDSIKQADLMLAVKNTAGGRHKNLAQGERAAANAKIPFVVVGRKLTRATLVKALVTIVDPDSPEAAAVKAEAEEAAAKAVANKAFADAWFKAAASWQRSS